MYNVQKERPGFVVIEQNKNNRKNEFNSPNNPWNDNCVYPKCCQNL